MSIATRFTSSTARPRIDLSGCVLYAPLWRPDLAGNTFKSLGVQAVPSYTCTVTGATHGSQGRTFDITDDKIQIGDTSDTALQFLTDTTIAVWGKLNTKTAESQSFLSKSNITTEDRLYIASGSASGFRIFWERDNVVTVSANNVGTLNVGQFYFMTLRFGSGGVKFDVDLVSLATDPDTGVLRTGTHAPLALGEDFNNDFELGGTVGDVFIYNRYLTNGELSSLRSETKGLYV